MYIYIHIYIYIKYYPISRKKSLCYIILCMDYWTIDIPMHFQNNSLVGRDHPNLSTVDLSYSTLPVDHVFLNSNVLVLFLGLTSNLRLQLWPWLLVITCYFYGIIHSINGGFLSTYNW